MRSAFARRAFDAATDAAESRRAAAGPHHQVPGRKTGWGYETGPAAAFQVEELTKTIAAQVRNSRLQLLVQP